ncbi:GGDEF domain-containing protein [Pseudomarimonas arenosa]|uniref:diguanylate cyclase n=1 Tax=Pseudomarimonas arenosa TaxID=2774145 RepID=A0AAW3ZQZ5_9GAMM|nr:GGDEF domain-containing protein [Pseudomarimonas arenosa]MBD8527960.1 GGDEF domain-containing protein [Pseudomarimonas arenosa]
MKMQWLGALVLALLLNPAAVISAVPIQGQPLLQRFTANDYGGDPANYGVLGLPNGILLCANSRGVLVFDGLRWELIELPGLSPARALFLGDDGVVYVGGYDLFGRLRIDETGLYRFEDLTAEFGLGREDAIFGVIWEVAGTSEGVLFRSDEHLYFLGYQGQREVWPADPQARRLFVIRDRIYSRVHGKGYARIERGVPMLEPGGSFLAERPLAAALPWNQGTLLITDDGFFRSEAEGIARVSGADHAVLSRYQSNAAIRLRDGSLMIASTTGELIHLNAELQLLAVHQVGPYSILSMEDDREGGLWVSTEGDLLRVKAPSPWSLFGAQNGLIGSPRATAFHQDRLWVATSAGVYASQPEGAVLQFKLEVATSLEASGLYADAHGLLIGDRAGALFRHPDGRVERLVETDSLFAFKPSERHPNLLYAFADSEVLLLQKHKPAWQLLARWPLGAVSTSDVLELDDQTLLLDNYRGDLQRWRFDPVSGELLQRGSIGAAEGLQVDPNFGSVMQPLGRRLFVVSGMRVFELIDGRATEYLGEPFSRAERPFEMGLAETELGDFAFTPNLLLRRLPGTQDWQPMQLGAGGVRGISSMRIDADGILRAINWSGVLQYDGRISEPAMAPLKVELAGFELRSSEGDSQRLPLSSGQALQLAGSDALSFDYVMPTMDPGVEARFRIDGYLNSWSDWVTPTRPGLTLRNPGPGSYTLRVEGRTRLGRVAQPLEFQFRVLPAWWQTSSARIALVFAVVLVLLAVAHLFVRFRYRQYLAANRRLEQRIAERTAELEAANAKLAELATEDSLTGVANRRALEQALKREWDRCADQRQPLAVIMVDVDYFKQFNDRHGHLEGDKELVRVARELAGRVRPPRELLARFGGEEFAVVLPNTDLNEALHRAESMRAAFDGSSSPNTVSVGVAAEVPRAGRDPLQLVRDADDALYTAKRAGRNRVMAAAA